jgi:hypothetical protein
MLLDTSKLLEFDGTKAQKAAAEAKQAPTIKAEVRGAAAR